MFCSFGLGLIAQSDEPGGANHFTQFCTRLLVCTCSALAPHIASAAQTAYKLKAPDRGCVAAEPQHKGRGSSGWDWDLVLGGALC